MAQIHPEVRAFIADRLPDGLDGREVADIARRVTAAPAPLETLNAVLAEYGDRFTVDGAKAFSVAARVLGDDGLADAADVFETTRQAVGETRNTIGNVQRQIEGLERANRAKSVEVDELVAAIATREQQIEKAKSKKFDIGLAGALLGLPVVTAVSITKMKEDDATLARLGQDKRAAEARRGELDGAIANYQSLKKRLGTKLERLQRAERRLGSDLEVETPPVSRSFVAVAQASSNLTRRQRLLDNLRSQLEILTEIRDAAADLGGNLDGTIAQLQRAVARADAMVDAAEASLAELVDIATAKDPGAAAEKWLERAVAKRTKTLMRELGLDVNVHIARLVKRAFPEGGAAADELRKALQASLRPDA